MKVNYSTSFAEFLRKSQSNCRVAEILHSVNVYGSGDDNFDLITTEEVNYLTFRGDGTISYLPAGKPHLQTDDNTWKREGRQNGKPAKIIRKLFLKDGIEKLRLKDADFECFSNAYKSNFNDDGYTFELLDNHTIGTVYDMTIASGGGSLNHSCMNGESDYLELYENCKQLQILILLNKDKELCGRALIWTIDDVTLMDRIYATQDFMYDKYLQYAEEKKLWRKSEYKSYLDKDVFIDTEGNKVRRTFIVNTSTDFDKYPYIDTFQYGGDGYLTNAKSGCQYEYCDTDGDRGGDDHDDDHDNEMYDDLNNEWINDDDAVSLERGRYSGYTTHIDNAVCIDDEYWCVYDTAICYVESENRFCAKENCVMLENGDWELIENAVCLDSDWYRTDDDEVILLDGQYWLKCSDAVFIDDDGEYQLRQMKLEL